MVSVQGRERERKGDSWIPDDSCPPPGTSTPGMLQEEGRTCSFFHCPHHLESPQMDKNTALCWAEAPRLTGNVFLIFSHTWPQPKCKPTLSPPTCLSTCWITWWITIWWVVMNLVNNHLIGCRRTNRVLTNCRGYLFLRYGTNLIFGDDFDSLKNLQSLPYTSPFLKPHMACDSTE